MFRIYTFQTQRFIFNISRYDLTLTNNFNKSFHFQYSKFATCVYRDFPSSHCHVISFHWNLLLEFSPDTGTRRAAINSSDNEEKKSIEKWKRKKKKKKKIVISSNKAGTTNTRDSHRETKRQWKSARAERTDSSQFESKGKAKRPGNNGRVCRKWNVKKKEKKRTETRLSASSLGLVALTYSVVSDRPLRRDFLLLKAV